MSASELLEAWHRHVGALVSARHGVGERPMSVGRLQSTALDALAVGQALVDAVSSTRWTTCGDALTYGATVAQVAPAMGLDVDEVVVGLRSWADGQLRESLMTREEYDAVLALVRGQV